MGTNDQKIGVNWRLILIAIVLSAIMFLIPWCATPAQNQGAAQTNERKVDVMAVVTGFPDTTITDSVRIPFAWQMVYERPKQAMNWIENRLVVARNDSRLRELRPGMLVFVKVPFSLITRPDSGYAFYAGRPQDVFSDFETFREYFLF